MGRHWFFYRLTIPSTISYWLYPFPLLENEKPSAVTVAYFINGRHIGKSRTILKPISHLRQIRVPFACGKTHVSRVHLYYKWGFLRTVTSGISQTK